jgi:hypothetical protein
MSEWPSDLLERHNALLERCTKLERALEELVQLKDGPRDDAYRAAKDRAWQRAHEALDG